MGTTALPLNKETFCQEMASHGKQIDAYNKAYNTKTMKASVIAQRASALMKRGEILTRISELKEKTKEIAEKKFEITQEEIVKKLNILMNADITDYIEFKKVTITRKTKAGKTVNSKKTVLQLKDLSKLTKEQTSCIESIRQTAHGPEIKLFGKYLAIEKINRIAGYYKEDLSKKQLYDSPEERMNRAKEIIEQAKQLAANAKKTA